MERIPREQMEAGWLLMDRIEREQMIADAILLERAEGVLARHRPPEPAGSQTLSERHASAEHVLRQKARELRQEAESGAC